MTIQSFNIIGISVRTTNQNGQSAIDIPALWHTFITEELATKIPCKTSDAVICMYTDYEKDHTEPYTTILGCKVENLDIVLNGMVGKTLAAGNYSRQEAKGNLMDGIVFAAWEKIWNADLPRVFTADFEVYDERAADPANA